MLCGQGHKTTLYQMPGTDGLDGIVCDTPTTEKIAIRDLRLVGNRAHQPTPNRGIYLSQRGTAFADFDGGDSAPTLMNLWLVEWKGAAVATDHLVRDLCAIRVHINRCDGPGFDLRCSDSSLVSCSAGNCAQGFNVRSYNTHYTTCKAFGSHGGGSSPGDGFYIAATGAKFSSCEAQDNWGRGFVLSNAANCVLTSVAADTNGVKLVGDDSVGIRIEDSHHCIVIGSAWNREGERATQEYALEIADGAHDLVVMLTSREHGSGHVRGDTGESNWVVINGRPRLPMVATDNLPRAGAAVDGTILIERGGRGSRNLVFYTGGQRLRVGGTPF
jgi:hypothetical protein